MTDSLRQRPGDQPLPTEGQENVQDALIQHIEDRKALGVQRYGRPLQTFNGRKAIKDLLDELLDGATYAMQVEMEIEATQARISKALHLHRADEIGVCVACRVYSPCRTRRVLLDVAEPQPEPHIKVVTNSPVEEIAVHPDFLDTFKEQLQLHTAEERLQQSILPGSVFGFDVVTDTTLPMGLIHLRPRPRTL
ncbi:hypothetical protein ACPCSE_29970 [Streptomyces cellulosae]